MPCQVHRDSVNARISEGSVSPIGTFVPECKESGHFQTKQRSGSSGYSFCYDKNGNKVESSDTPPGPPGLDCSIYVDEDGNRKLFDINFHRSVIFHVLYRSLSEFEWY